MTRGPRRLKDDPDFKWETGCDIEDEARVVGTYDLETSRSRLLAAVALLPPVTVGDGVPTVRPGSSAWKIALRPVVGAITGALLVGGAYWLGVRAGTDGEAAPTAVPSESVRPAAPETVQAAPAPQGIEAPAARPEPTLAPPILKERGAGMRAAPIERDPIDGGASDAALPATDAVSTVPGFEGGASGTGESSDSPLGAPAPPVEAESQFKAEFAILDPANDALDAGRYGDARKGYERYLARFPNGKMTVEAQWGLLKSLSADDAAGTEVLAAQLQDLPAFSARREDILRLRAESLVHLDRCDDALLVAEGLSSRSAAEIKRACRQPRRE